MTKGGEESGKNKEGVKGTTKSRVKVLGGTISWGYRCSKKEGSPYGGVALGVPRPPGATRSKVVDRKTWGGYTRRFCLSQFEWVWGKVLPGGLFLIAVFRSR